jgi:hypothetical protein
MGVAAKDILFRSPWRPAMMRPFGDSLIPDWAIWTDPQFLNPQGMVRLNAESTLREGLQGEVSVDQWRPREITFTSHSQSDNWLIARRLYYPGWVATTAAGRALPVGPSSGTGLIQVKVPGGINKVRLILPWDWSEKLGMAMTAFFGLLASGLLLTGLREGFDHSASSVLVNTEGAAA